VLTEVALPIALAVIMVSLGLSLTPADFRRVFVVPRGVGIGLLNLLLISPLLAFLVAIAFDLGPVLAVGLVLLGASPGGTTANLMTHLARGDVALSVTMTAVSSVAALVTVPLYLGLAIDYFDASGIGNDVSLGGIVARVFFITIVPLAIGMALRRRYPERVEAVYDRVRQISLGAAAPIAQRTGLSPSSGPSGRLCSSPSMAPTYGKSTAPSSRTRCQWPNGSNARSTATRAPRSRLEMATPMEVTWKNGRQV